MPLEYSDTISISLPKRPAVWKIAGPLPYPKYLVISFLLIATASKLFQSHLFQKLKNTLISR
jgi:hypothetical protein